MKKMVDPFDYSGEFAKHMGKGILLTTKGESGVNTMTIGWGTIGIEWGRPMFVAYVRESRYTHEMLERSGEFTVNIPVGAVDSKILGVCGTKSGRDMDKIRELNLTLEEPMNISVPGIKELPLTLECKILYRMEQTLDTIPQDIIEKYYPNGDFHYAYYGQIVGAYIAE
jgi:flavin reductase (DIM6/NTAB) family NADH-FMN oxidoreductase RutF